MGRWQYCDALTVKAGTWRTQTTRCLKEPVGHYVLVPQGRTMQPHINIGEDSATGVVVKVALCQDHVDEFASDIQWLDGQTDPRSTVDEGVPRMPDGVGICDGCGLEFDWSELQDMDGLWCPDCQEVPDDA